MENMENVYGIDLGTTQSCISILDPGAKQPRVFPNADDSSTSTTPSVVWYNGENPIVGKYAKEMWGVEPERVVVGIKRTMHYEKLHEIKIGQINVTSVDISSFILKNLVDSANAILKVEGIAPINKVLITVPAYFGDRERERTIEAGKKADLEVIGVVEEPAAAALFYSFKLQGNRNKTVLVYDLGGGTFDVCIIKLEDNNIDVLAKEGDHCLGGMNWDKKLAHLALTKLGIKVDNINDLEKTPEGCQLLLEMENLKKKLSNDKITNIKSFFKYGGKTRNVEITIEEFETYTQILLDKTHDLMQVAAKQAGRLNMDGTINVDEILLVGGSSRMQMVTKMMHDRYRKEPQLFEPELAVAKGAAIQAKYRYKVMNQLPTDGPVIRKNIGAHSYGLEIAWEDETDKNKTDKDKTIIPKISNLIKKNEEMKIHSEFNTAKNNGYVTKYDDQTSVNIAIYENESGEDTIDIVKGTLVKAGKINWRKPVPKGTPINVILDRDDNGIIHIKAGCQGEEIELVIESR